MNTKYKYLNDIDFLTSFTELQLKEQFVKITILNFEEKPIKEIQGQITSGSLNIDGSSCVRRTCNLTFLAKDGETTVTEVNNIISINKKVRVEIGFTNTTDFYPEYEMIWFPLGVYLIINPSITNNNSGLTISLQLKDKMCLLNGECGGVIPASTTFSEYDVLDADGKYQTLKPTIYDIIQKLVHHFGGEQLGKILIDGIDTKIRKVMKWSGSSPVYAVYDRNSNGVESLTYTTDETQIIGKDAELYTEYPIGRDIGYQLVDFVYPGELTVDAGATITSVLDTIKNALGNFEYFYDLDGNFVFQEIRNFLNTSQSSTILRDLSKNSNLYMVDVSKGKTVQRFTNKNIIISYSNSPQFSMIYNDFTIWGERKTALGSKIPIRYHLAIDERPSIGNYYEVYVYKDESGYERAILPQTQYANASLAELNKNANNLYKGDVYSCLSNTTSPSRPILAQWSGENNSFIELAESHFYTIKTTDYRTELYLSGILSDPFGTASNYYYTELVNEWPKLYNIIGEKHVEEQEDGSSLIYYTGCWRQSASDDSSNIDYYLDIIEPNTDIGKISVKNIGRRSKVVKDASINCIFEPTVPDLILIQSNTNNTRLEREEAIKRGYDFLQIDDLVFNALSTGGNSNSAFETIKDLLYQYTNYNESITISCLPMYYLEPNTRIFVRDENSGIQGDFVIKSMSLPLDVNGTMSISANKALERI